MKFNKQALLEALKNIQADPALIVEVGADNRFGRWDCELKVRYMKTAGGMQFGIKEVTSRGEGSGAYYPADQVEQVADCVINLINRYEENSRKFCARFSFPFTEREMSVREDNFHRSIHLDSLERDPVLKNAETITLG